MLAPVAEMRTVVVPVVLVSAAREGSDVADRYSVPFVRKPFELSDLASTVASAIRDRRTPRLPR